MKKFCVLAASFVLSILLTLPALSVRAESAVTWTSNSYALTRRENGVEISGAATYGNRCSTTEKIEMDGCELTLDLEFDFQNASFDWLAVIFAASVSPYLTSGAATSLILRPRGTELVFSIMNSNLTEVATEKTAFAEGEPFRISAALTKNSVEFTVNGATIFSDNGSLNYAMLSRGVYCSVSANGGTNSQDAPFQLEIENTNVAVHDSLKDEIVYGSTVTVKDEGIADLVSENFSVGEKQDSAGCQSSLYGNASFGVLIMAAVVLLLQNKKSGRKER